MLGSTLDLDRRPALSPWPWLIAAAVVAMQLSVAGRYGIFRDELYYLMCADHPAWGYVDHPPLAMLFLTCWKAVFGASVFALRVPPSLLHGFVALGAGMIAREMRGNAAAQALAAVVVGLMPGVVALGGFYSMNAFDTAFWVLIAWIVCRLVDPAADRRWWWGLGVALGLGVLNKYSVVFLGVGLGVGILLSPLRREFLSGWRWTVGLVPLAIAAPHLIWESAHGWPTFEFMRNAALLKNVAMGPGDFWGEQMLMSHPGFLPVWLSGLVGLLFLQRLRPWRPLGVAFAVVAIWLTFAHAKPYYLVTAYPMVFAAGAVAITNWLARWRRVARVTAVLLPLLLAAEGLAIAPLAIPLLSPADFTAWSAALGISPKPAEHNAIGELPQHFADRFGWKDLARTVRGVTDELSPAERAVCLVVTGNYGECGALNYFGMSPGMRPAVSGHNSCWTWWPADLEPEVVVLVGVSQGRADALFYSVTTAAVHRSDLAMPYEREIPILVCRGWKITPREAREGARFAI